MYSIVQILYPEGHAVDWLQKHCYIFTIALTINIINRVLDPLFLKYFIITCHKLKNWLRCKGYKLSSKDFQKIKATQFCHLAGYT